MLNKPSSNIGCNLKYLVSSTALLYALSGTPTSAQSDQIIVTAQKREQSLQDVALSITAFSGSQLKNLGIQDQTQLTAQTPGLTLENFGPSINFRIRGVGTETFNESAESSAAFYRDEIYRPTMAGNSGQLFDVERVEVLRGPQGTLYGRNSNAGLVHVYSKRPTEEFEGYGELQGGSFGQVIAEGAVSGPLTDFLRGRVAAKYNRDAGIQDNLGSGGGDFWKTDILGVRGQLEFDFSDSADFLLRVGHTRQRNTSALYAGLGIFESDLATPCSASEYLGMNCFADATAGTGAPTPFKFTDQATEGSSEQSDLINDIDITEVSGHLKWKLNDQLELVSLTSFEKIDRFYEEDADASDFGSTSLAGQLKVFYTFDAATISQELRLHGSHERIDWVVGAYYFSDKKDDIFTGIVGGLFGSPFESLAAVKTESIAGFADLNVDLTDDISLIAGFRFTEDDREIDVFVPETGGFEAGSSSWTYRAGLEWSPNDDLLLYALNSTGVKSPEFSSTLLFAAADAAPVSEEKVSSFEVGSKWSFLEGKGHLNTSLFYTMYEDFQDTVFQSSIGTRFINAGDVDTYGAEAELTVQPVENLSLMMGLSWLETEIDSTAFSTEGGVTTPIDGNELANSPNISINGLARYDVPTQTLGVFSGQVDFSWRGDQFHTNANRDFDVEEAYSLVNLRLFWEAPDGRVYAQVFVENVTDTHYLQDLLDVLGDDRAFAIWGKPRTYGGKIGVQF